MNPTKKRPAKRRKPLHGEKNELIARLMNLNREQTINAFGIACSKASGVKAQFGTMGKPYHAGIAASSAVESVNLAKNNFVSYEKALEGKQGFGETHHSEFNKNAFDNLGQEFIFEKVIYKTTEISMKTSPPLVPFFKTNTISMIINKK